MTVRKGMALCVLIGMSQYAAAHHSFAPHYDRDSHVSITGTIVEFELRNPHAYLHIRATDENGEPHEYTCESSGITQLKRNGLDPDLLAYGSTVTVTGQQHRRDKYRCYFRTVQVGDGPVFNVGGAVEPLAVAKTSPEPAAGEGIFGRWLLVPNGPRAGNGESYASMLDHMTEAGKRAEAAYNPYTDDPVYRCNPIGVRRVWMQGGTPTEIVRDGDRVVLRHEWMDVERVVHLDPDARPDSGPRTTLGHSIGRLENGVLTIETSHYPAGVIRQYVETGGDVPFRGLLNSDAMSTTEVLRYDAESQSLEVTIYYRDPGFYDSDFPPLTARYERTDLQIQHFGCKPEV